MEHQRYTISAEKVTQHIKRTVPKTAIVHYWYEVPQTSPDEDIQTEDKESPENEVQHPQLKAFLTDMKKYGGLHPEDVDAMKKYSQEFRDNFDL